MPNAEKAPQRQGMVSLADEEAVKEILSTTVMDLWEVVNNLTRLRPSRRERYRVAIFGSARAQPGSFVPRCLRTADEAIAVVRDLHAKWRQQQPGAAASRSGAP